MKLYKIKKSDIDKKGRGLYATKDIKEGTKIIDYVGKLITKNKLKSLINMTIVNQSIYLLSTKDMTLMEIFHGILQA
jgi:hypothetical protein